MNTDYNNACLKESQRLRIAEKWANFFTSDIRKQFFLGRADRIAGKPCSSTNGNYLDGYYSV